MSIHSELYNWYQINKRDLPWRETTDPYHIWVSEIILQQTRVVQGKEYYLRFIQQFPTVESLANASEDEVLRLWQGLGYYSRARNLHAAANSVMTTYGGTFPSEHKEILSLKGIGIYTAAAIASFSFELPYAVVDGNVLRVLARLFGVDTPIDTTKGMNEFRLIAQEFMEHNQPSLHNQAIMEFGALQCVPSNPNCEGCVLRPYCIANQNKCVDSLPKKSKQKRVKRRFLNYFYVTDEKQDRFLLYRREGSDIWKGLYEFPMIETASEVTSEEIDNFCRLIIGNQSAFEIDHRIITKRHILTHQELSACLFRIKTKDIVSCSEKYLIVSPNEIDNYPLSRLMEIFFEELG